MLNETTKRGQFHIRMTTFLFVTLYWFHNMHWIQKESSIFFIVLNCSMIFGVVALWLDDTVFKRKIFFIFSSFYWLCNIYAISLIILQHSPSLVFVTEKVCRSAKNQSIGQLRINLTDLITGGYSHVKYIMDCTNAVVVMFMPEKSGFTDAEDCLAYFMSEDDVRNHLVLTIVFIGSVLLPLDNYNFWKDKQTTEKAKKLL